MKLNLDFGEIGEDVQVRPKAGILHTDGSNPSLPTQNLEANVKPEAERGVTGPSSQPYIGTKQTYIVHQRMEVTLYNGKMTYPPRMISCWLENYTPPPKKEKKVAEAPKVQVAEEESY